MLQTPAKASPDLPSCREWPTNSRRRWTPPGAFDSPPQLIVDSLGTRSPARKSALELPPTFGPTDINAAEDPFHLAVFDAANGQTTLFGAIARSAEHARPREFVTAVSAAQ